MTKFKKRNLKHHQSFADAVQLQPETLAEILELGVRQLDVGQARALLEKMAGAINIDKRHDPDGTRQHDERAALIARSATLTDGKVYAEVPLGDNTSMLAEEGDWIARHEAGNLYAYSPSVFSAVYGAVG